MRVHLLFSRSSLALEWSLLAVSVSFRWKRGAHFGRLCRIFRAWGVVPKSSAAAIFFLSSSDGWQWLSVLSAFLGFVRPQTRRSSSPDFLNMVTFAARMQWLTLMVYRHESCAATQIPGSILRMTVWPSGLFINHVFFYSGCFPWNALWKSQSTSGWNSWKSFLRAVTWCGSWRCPHTAVSMHYFVRQKVWRIWPEMAAISHPLCLLQHLGQSFRHCYCYGRNAISTGPSKRCQRSKKKIACRTSRRKSWSGRLCIPHIAYHFPI